MGKKDYYELLGVDKNDSKDAIKKAYKKLALKYHPDRAPDSKKEEYESKFKEMSEAYSVLSDDNKKSQYDSHGHSAFDGSGGGAGGFGGGGFDYADIFGDIFGGGGRSSRGRRRKVGEDLQYRVILDFEEAAFGCEKEILIEKNILCSSCDGTGSKDKKLSSCSKCGGRGRILVEHDTPFGRFRQEGVCDECEGEGKVPKNKCSRCSGQGVILERKKTKVKLFFF